MQLKLDTEELVHRVLSVPVRHKRRLVALAGPPAGGKTTLAEQLAEQTEKACVVPMDGFHLDNRILRARNLSLRKGAPETFDIAGLSHLLERLTHEEEVFFPLFDRKLDSAIAGAGRVGPETETLYVEGNYLLLNRPGWQGLQHFWDLSIYLATNEQTLRERLMQRWLDHGFSHRDAQEKMEVNDLRNALEITEHLIPPNIVLEGD